MTRTMTDKLVATVVELTDLGSLFPASALKGRIGLDIRIERGSLAPGKRVRLSGPGCEELLEIVGIEMLSNAHDPNVIRILCWKPKMRVLPTGKAEGWTIAED
jgi:hypothetical protein